ncbi:N-ethylmaleimide reductase, FMN-linked [Thiomonas arsenitoxydans]|uniref:N-ethylmaleimide reductase, FMN-linked n=1 Tax=Thiomonas arsenitoxydans (strain DSM 22701 / CIP 110005 / 3As) TaxID=426114 RepID=D6CSN5_THIA3|nr:alkene reductase [Thiomonas arsenitoxydans]CAZ88304.1 N-ethylmaleimide reductase, FMN-linked [Thiomonas arsenitoxydans]CQR33118.1 N-ethylmaleimide reductase, FMN-linked [Thiomonas arsenitoxydans]CQR33356.1 N-ethylmaleimide reductase, FMN-linked [Thiomonas arsenitoxydans]CQR33595.1 N-ethylmaleimide reductase, FMN-linked [Thiomonas arsenitoxydans]CQR40013.1 N-ethylmaleimide reductase, FMN-linked [Thiomonas arsenitoxydans]
MTAPTLFTPLQLGALQLPNRMVMAPLTRSRAQQPGDIPGEMNARYYAQRASAGLIVSEATQISRQGQGYAFTPGIYSDAQVAGWKIVTDAVHAAGGHMAMQLWHVGRISHHLLQQDGQAPVAPSALRSDTGESFVVLPDEGPKRVPCDMPRALETAEIPGIIADYRRAAERALQAGFDLLELHSANGYLLQQFLATNANQRTDQYGGSLENRARIVLEAIDALIAVAGANRVGVRISPHFNRHDIQDAQTEEIHLYLAQEFNRRGIAYIHIAEPDWAGGPALTDEFRKKLRAAYAGRIIVCGNYTLESAEARLASGLADAVAFGRPFIANPDLVARFQQGAALNKPNPATFYGGGEAGYTDYPSLDATPATV